MGRTRGQPAMQGGAPQETTIRSRLFNVFEITLLFCAAAAGSVAAVTVALTQADFQGDCMLFAQVEYTSRLWFRIDVNPSSIQCDFCIALQIFLSVASLLLIMLRVIVICTNLIKPPIRHKLRLYFMVPFFAITSFTVLAQATIITAGLNTFCRGLMDGTVDNMRCWMMQPITWVVYDGFRFYDRLFKGMEKKLSHDSQEPIMKQSIVLDYIKLECMTIASWFSFLIWSVLTTSSCLVAIFSKKPIHQ